jgi:antitoxin PrlF
MSYKGKISTSGTSEAIRFEKSLFKQHPEFKQQAEVRADIIGPGTLLVSVVGASDVQTEEDPVVCAFLSFLEKDMLGNPQNITPLSEHQMARAKAITDGVTVSDDELE